MARKARQTQDPGFQILLPFSVKELGMTTEGEEELEIITIEGRASYCGDIEAAEACCYIDRANDVVVPAGMDLTNYKKNPVILWNHDRECPIGKALDIQKKADGIYITAEIHYGACEDEAFYAIKNGLVNSFSIGFRTKAAEWKSINDADVYFITRSELFEVSIVTIPCNVESGFSILKSFGTDGFRAAPAPAAPHPTHGDTTMKLKRKELLTAEVIAQHTSLGLEADLEGEVEVSTKSYLETLVARKFAELKADLLAAVDEKLKSDAGDASTEVPQADEKSAEVPQEEEVPPKEDDVEIKEADVTALKSAVDKLKALFA